MIFHNDPVETFSRFWLAYPRHTHRKDALIAWCRLDPDEALITTIIEALAWQRQQPQWTTSDGRFIPHAATYIRGERWNDEKTTTATSTPTVTRFASLGMHHRKI